MQTRCQPACAQMDGVCAANATMCEKRTGCATGSFFCRHKRDADGNLEIDAGTKFPVAVCEAATSSTCTGKKPGKGREPESVVKEMRASKGEKLQAWEGSLSRWSRKMRASKGEKLQATDSSGRLAVVIEMLMANAFTAADGSSTAVNFTIGSVADSIVQNGGLGSYYASGAIMSAVLVIEPSQEVVVNDGFLIQLPIETAAGEECVKIVTNIAILTIHDVNDLDASPEIVAVCTA
ncbi:hypothetical protein T484DRAFT_1840921, partial [Baffinella frigidus]